MKRTVKLIVCVVLVLCTLFTFAACKKNKKEKDDQSTPTASIYYLAGATYGNTTYTLDQLWIDDPAQNYVFFDIDGTGILCLDYAEYYFEYADGQLWNELDPESKVNYIISGDALTLEQDGYKLVFTQGDLPEWALPSETEEDVDNTLPAEESAEESGEEVPATEEPAATEATTAG